MTMYPAARLCHTGGMSDNPARQRLRITFGKFDALKYTSNLDVAKIWERVLRRADLPLLYSQGFNTRPRLQLATALPLGITSECELLDVTLRERIRPEGLEERLRPVSPAGLRIYRAQEVDVGEAALQTRVRSARYVVTFAEPAPGLVQSAEALLARESIPRRIQRKRRVVEKDLRPLIHELVADDAQTLRMRVAVGDRGNLRPRDLLEEMALNELWHQVHRQQLLLDDEEETTCN